MTDLAEFLIARFEAEQLRACSVRRITGSIPNIEHVGGMTGVETYVVNGGMRRRISQDEYRAIVEANSEPAPDEHAAATASALMRLVAMHGRHETAARFERWDHDEKQMTRWSGAACNQCGHIDEWPIEWPCPTLRLLAVRYAKHDDYREEWRP